MVGGTVVVYLSSPLTVTSRYLKLLLFFLIPRVSEYSPASGTSTVNSAEPLWAERPEIYLPESRRSSYIIFASPKSAASSAGIVVSKEPSALETQIYSI